MKLFKSTVEIEVEGLLTVTIMDGNEVEVQKKQALKPAASF